MQHSMRPHVRKPRQHQERPYNHPSQQQRRDSQPERQQITHRYVARRLLPQRIDASSLNAAGHRFCRKRLQCIEMLYLHQKAVALPRNCFDVRRIFRRITESLPQLVH